MRLGSWLPSPTLVTVCAWAPLLALPLLVSGCETDATGPDELGDDESESAEDSSGDEDPNWEPIPARGDINLSLVVVNQGVDVPIAVNGEWVDGAARNTFVVANRDTLLRGFWEIPEDWVPRVIRAQLELRYPDGTSEIRTDDKLIESASFPGDFNRAFVFPLIADELPPGIEFHLSLWEAEPGAEDQRESTTVLEAPIGGLQQIGVQPEPLEMKVVLVPVRYNTGSCSTDTSQITEEEEQLFLDYIHEQNPVREVIWDFRRSEPIEWNTTLTSLAQLWQPLQEMRITDAAPPNAYYYALVDACANGVDGAGGIAPGLAPPTKEAAYMRVSSGLWLGGNNYAYHTMVHELGHNQGRAHIFCAGGNAAGVDPSYPYDNGVIGVWGFGIRLFRFHNPTGTYDYMSYCGPNWVSDWTWTKTFNQIRILTSWDYEGAAHEPAQHSADQGEVLIGLLMKDGTEQWWTTPGGREDAYFTGEQTISFDYAGERIDRPAAIEPLDDGSTMITAEVPRPRVEIDGAVRRVDGEERVITLQPSRVQAPGL